MYNCKIGVSGATGGKSHTEGPNSETTLLNVGFQLATF